VLRFESLKRRISRRRAWAATPVLLIALLATIDGDRPVREIRTLPAPTGLGPRGAPTFCLAPPVPEKNDRPPFQEWAPALNEFQLDPTAAKRLFQPADTTRVLMLLAAFADVAFDTSAIDTTGLGNVDRDTLLVPYFRKVMRYCEEFYADVSYGKSTIQTTIPDTVFTLPFRMRYYGNDDLFGERGTKLIWDAVAAADGMVDFADYDGIGVIHAGAGQESDVERDSETQVWSAYFPQALISFVMSDSLGRDVPGIPTNDTTAAGDTIYVEGAALLPETEQQDGYDFSLIGVFTHELGHVVAGWPDLYDTTPDDPSSGLGAFCLMAAGTWNARGYVPAEPSAWCRMYAGWLDPVPFDAAPDEGRTVTLTYIEKDRPAAEDTTLAWIPLSGDEYFLVNCRKPDPNSNGKFDWVRGNLPDTTFTFWTDSYAGAEFNFYTPNTIPGTPQDTTREAAGVYIWHIDESVVTFGFPFNRVNADPHHMGIDLEEADGLQDLEFDIYSLLSFGSPDDAFRADNNDAFTPMSVPSSKSSFGGPSDVWITNISAADTVMTFTLQFKSGGIEDAPAVAEGWPVELPDGVIGTQPSSADLDADGEAEFIVMGSSGSLSVLRADGTLYFQKDIGTTVSGSPLVGDIDDEDGLEIVVPTAAGGIYVWESDGAPYQGHADGLFATVDSIGGVDGVLADVDRSDDLELIIGSDDDDAGSANGKMWVVDFAASDQISELPVSSAVATAPVVVWSGDRPVCVQPLSAGGLAVTLLSDELAPVSARAGDASIVFGAPAASDLDRDGDWEILTVGDDGRVHVYRLTGGGVPGLDAVSGWPVDVAAIAGTGVSAADVDADGYNDVLVVGTGGSLHVINYNGVHKPGWPKTLDSPEDVYFDYIEPHPAPLVADVDADGRLELIGVFSDGRIAAVAAGAGRSEILPGWPVQSAPGSVPVVGDFQGSGQTSVFAVEAPYAVEGDIMWTRATLWNLGTGFESHLDEWPMYRRDAARNATIGASSHDVLQGVDMVRDVYCQPNPAGRDGTRFHYLLGPSIDRVEIRVYDLTGMEVRKLHGSVNEGVDNLVLWDGENSDGNAVAPGLYVYRLAVTQGSTVQSIVGKLAVVR